MSMAFMMPSMTEILVIVAVAILLFGSTRIPKVCRGLGQGLVELRKALRGFSESRGELEEPDDERR